MEQQKEHTEIHNKEEARQLLRDALAFSKRRAMLIRIVGGTIVGAGTIAFLGFGNRNIIDYIILLLIIEAAYILGRSDLKEISEGQTIEKISKIIEEADEVNLFFSALEKTQEEDEEGS